MSIITQLDRAREDLAAARAARTYYEQKRAEARDLEAEQERPQDRMQYALRAVSMRMEMDAADKKIAALSAEIAGLEAAHAISLQPVVLTAEQLAAVDDTAGLLP